MPNLKDSGFLLRRIPFSESSLILKVFTREHGLLSFLAKGARRQNSRLHGLLEPGLQVQYLFPARARGELRILGDVALLRDFPGVREDILKQALAQVFGEILLRYTPAEASAPEFHDLLLDSHARLDEGPGDRGGLRNAFASFLLGYFRLSGFQPQFRACVHCGGSVEGANLLFRLDLGGPECARCRREEPGAHWMRESTLRWLDAVQNGFCPPDPGRAESGRAQDFLLVYLGRHAGGQKALKSVPVWNALMD